MRLLFLTLTAACARLPDAKRADAGGPEVTWAGSQPLDDAPLGSEAALDRDFLPLTLEAVDAATEEIRVAQFLLTDDAPVDQLLNALSRAVARGVSVRVLADEEGDDTARVVRNLALDGVDAKLDSPQRMTHNKLVIADEIVVVGSHNWTSAALGRNHEASLRLIDAEAAGWYSDWFDAVWAEPGTEPELPDWPRTDIVPLADRDLTPAILDCISEAEQVVELAMYCWLWDDRYPGSDVDQVLSEIEAAQARGVNVQVVLDDSDWVRDNLINDAAIARLQVAGVEVWRSPHEVTMHAKVLRCDDRLIVSDANWTYSGLEQVSGTSAQVAVPELVDAAAAWMAELRESSRRE